MTEIVGEAVGKRLAGERPSRAQSLLAATAAGLVVAVTAYKLLRTIPFGL